MSLVITLLIRDVGMFPASTGVIKPFLSKHGSKVNNFDFLPGDQEGLFKLVVQLRKIFNSVIYNTATGYVLLVYLTNI
jgi:hypothetical protein